MATWATTRMLRDRCRSRLALTLRVGRRLNVARPSEFFASAHSTAGGIPVNAPATGLSSQPERTPDFLHRAASDHHVCGSLVIFRPATTPTLAASLALLSPPT
jgi:hypothetical protein